MTKRTFQILLLMLVLMLGVTACAGTTPPTPGTGDTDATVVPATTPEPADEPTSEATVPTEPTEAPTIVAASSPVVESTPEGEVSNGMIMIFKRDGGFAGFCDTMTISADLITLESCNANFPSGEMATPPDVAARLLALQEQYAPISASETDAPGASDAMTFTVEFFGTGSESLTPEVQSELMKIGQDILNNFASES